MQLRGQSWRVGDRAGKVTRQPGAGSRKCRGTVNQQQEFKVKNGSHPETVESQVWESQDAWLFFKFFFPYFGLCWVFAVVQASL